MRARSWSWPGGTASTCRSSRTSSPSCHGGMSPAEIVRRAAVPRHEERTARERAPTSVTRPCTGGTRRQWPAGSGWPSSSAVAAASTRSRCVRPAASCARSTATGTTWCRSASRRDGSWVLDRRRPGAAASMRPVGAARRSRRRAGRAGRRPDRARAGRRSSRARRSGSLGEVDVVFPLLHGPFGEDGTLQGLFEMAGVPYVGSGRLRQRRRHGQGVHEDTAAPRAGLPVGPYVVIAGATWRRRPVPPRRVGRAPGLPVFVKPARAGSSVGITKVHRLGRPGRRGRAGLRSTTQGARSRPLTSAARSSAACWRASTAGPRASVPAEIRLVRDHEFYDFEAKYLDDACEFDVPADLPGRS